MSIGGLAHGFAHQDVPGRGAVGDARGDVHVVSDEIAVPGARLARVDADAELDARSCGAGLHDERRLHRLGGRGKGDHQTVAEPLHEAAPVAADRRQHRIVVTAEQLDRGAVATSRRIGREPLDVGEHERDRPATRHEDAEHARHPLETGETAEQLRRLALEVASGEAREAASTSHHCSNSVVSKKTSSTTSHS